MCMRIYTCVCIHIHTYIHIYEQTHMYSSRHSRYYFIHSSYSIFTCTHKNTYSVFYIQLLHVCMYVCVLHGCFFVGMHVCMSCVACMFVIKIRTVHVVLLELPVACMCMRTHTCVCVYTYTYIHTCIFLHSSYSIFA
jgi:hypothetical protein